MRTTPFDRSVILSFSVSVKEDLSRNNSRFTSEHKREKVFINGRVRICGLMTIFKMWRNLLCSSLLLPLVTVFMFLVSSYSDQTQVMYFTYLMIAMMAVAFPFPSEASSKTCPRWVKLNKSPVCFGAKGNQYGRFSYHGNIFVSSFMLVHRSGKVACDRSSYSYWGCEPNQAHLSVILTDQSNKILAPEASTVSKGGGYTLPGYTSSSSAVVFCAPKKPHCVFANSELRLWHGQDLRGFTESNNSGKTCADGYGLLA